MTSESTALSRLSDDLANAVEHAAASIVTVKARRGFGATGIAWGADGLVLTSSHVVERDENIGVTLPDGTEAKATLAGRDPGSDLAVLRVSGAVLTPATLVPAGATRVGQMVLALGRPAGGAVSASFGVVSAISGAWRTMSGGQVDGSIRTDTTFYPGFSGGPLIDAQGRVVGINSSRLGRGSGITIPAEAAAKIAAALASKGKISRGWLGIASQPARLTAALTAKAGGQETGLLVLTVEPGSPAETAGLLMGDVIITMGGAKMEDTDDLQAQLGPESVGQALELTILRGGNPQTLTVTVGERK